MENVSFKNVLQNELVRRCQENPHYSLRSFAKSLQVEPSALSQILRGKRNLTKKMTIRLANALKVSPEEMAGFREININEEKKEASFMELHQDMYEVLSDWYHFAILELMNVSSFQSDTSWIARSLGITSSEVNISIERMRRLGLLKVNEDGSWTDLSGGKTNLGDPGLTNNAFKLYQKRILALSGKAVEEVAIEKRDHSGTTLAIDSSKLPEAKKIIREFRRKLGRVMTGNNSDQVYQLQVSFFPLSKSLGD